MMTKGELIQFLQPFHDDIEIALVVEETLCEFDITYKPTGFGLDKDYAAVVIEH